MENINKYIEYKMHNGIHGKITRFGLEIFDWGIFIFFTMASILILKKHIILAILTDAALMIFLRKYKKNKPDYYTRSLVDFIVSDKELYP